MPPVVFSTSTLDRKTSKMIRFDIESARTFWVAEAETEKEEKKRLQTDFLLYQDEKGKFADFHCLRHTFITNLGKAKVSPKMAQTLMLADTPPGQDGFKRLVHGIVPVKNNDRFSNSMGKNHRKVILPAIRFLCRDTKSVHIPRDSRISARSEGHLYFARSFLTIPHEFLEAGYLLPCFSNTMS